MCHKSNHLLNPPIGTRLRRTKDPAGLLSPGLTPTEIMNFKLWFFGPDWLTEPETSCTSHVTNIKQLNLTDIPELNMKHQIFHIGQVVHFDISRFSSLTILKRGLGYVFRFNTKCSKTKESRQYNLLY